MYKMAIKMGRIIFLCSLVYSSLSWLVSVAGSFCLCHDMMVQAREEDNGESTDCCRSKPGRCGTVKSRMLVVTGTVEQFSAIKYIAQKNGDTVRAYTAVCLCVIFVCKRQSQEYPRVCAAGACLPAACTEMLKTKRRKGKCKNFYGIA